MQLPESTPGKGCETPRVEQFSYTNTPAGLKNVWTGWLAARPYWCKAHEHKPPTQIGTKPCLEWMTKGAVHCPWCKPSAQITDVAYCHVYREVDGAPCLVLCHDSVADLMAGLSFGSHVLIGRVEGKSSSFVKPTETRLPFRTNLDHRKAAIDIAVSLLGIWSIPALVAWYAKQGGAVEARAPQCEPPVQGREVKDWRRFVELGSLGGMEGAVTPGTANTNEQFVSDVKRAKPSANGRHKKD